MRTKKKLSGIDTCGLCTFFGKLCAYLPPPRYCTSCCSRLCYSVILPTSSRARARSHVPQSLTVPLLPLFFLCFFLFALSLLLHCLSLQRAVWHVYARVAHTYTRSLLQMCTGELIYLAPRFFFAAPMCLRPTQVHDSVNVQKTIRASLIGPYAIASYASFKMSAAPASATLSR